jgi:HD-GYP domain-containing protein (c-di-GMP phosphodiesterase class II)
LIEEQRQRAEVLRQQQERQRIEARRLQQQERQRIEALILEEERQRAAAAAAAAATAAQVQQQEELARRARAVAKKKQKEEERERRRQQKSDAQRSRRTLLATITEDSAETSSAVAPTDEATGAAGTQVPQSSRKRQHELVKDKPTEPGGGQLVVFSREVQTEPSQKKNKSDSGDILPLLGVGAWVLSEELERPPAEAIDLPPDYDL